MSSPKFSRRDFVKTTAASASAMAIAGLATARVMGANDRINMGVIGVGGMGTGHVGSLVKRADKDNVRVLAVCDVYRRRITRAQGICKGDGYMDYRKLLDRNDIDAVLIATPDHWHGKISIDAMAAGKHVYVEKPMTHTVEQALELRDAVRRYKKVLQVGPNGTGNDSY
ncbi:MAG: Gfo/Idh/MocA family oxidoreductase, partial [Planctomycetota bacterium]